MKFTALEVDIINSYQKEIPINSRPYLAMAKKHNISEQDVLNSIIALQENKIISRFGPMFNIEKSGGKFMLCALAVPNDEFEQVVQKLNQIDEVAHNYERTHEKFNMWFVAATATDEQMEETLNMIEEETGHKVYSFNKEEEFYINLYLPVEGPR